ncbi:MAG: glycosyl transferase family 1 [Candidatus Aenigmatarchaeota archaeon]|nr:MAG: glycosyl transferase family 1 [Candidatus Aenigmarchaeota archaeon]
MERRLKDYKKFVGKETIERILSNASALSGLRLIHINSTSKGGGVAEILSSMVPLMRSVGIEAEWKVIQAPKKFFAITKKLHNNLQGADEEIKEEEKKIYLEVNKKFSKTKLDYECVIVHDPQPLATISFIKKTCPWIWRCHIDLSAPNPSTWNFLKNFILRYDHLVVSMKKYIKKDITLACSIIPPSIDPLTEKNKELSKSFMISYLEKNGITLEKPVIAQISRFDKWKDPIGVVKVFEKVKRKVDCMLVMLGSFASDDPEGFAIYKELREYCKNKDDVKIIAKHDTTLVNCLQSMACVVLQKSIKEGFGLTISEALWKKTPVIGSNVGGIPLQIVDGKSGYLVEPYDYADCARKVVKLVENEGLRRNMGEFGKEWVKEHFLITRHLNDWINVIKEVIR